MNTPDLLQAYLKDAEERGISQSSRQTFWYRLRHFAEAFPELPTSPKVIETFLGARGETPTKRGNIHKELQAFYSYIEKKHGIKSPVPSKGKVGRPRVNRLPQNQRTFLASNSTPSTPDKLVQGGPSASRFMSTSTDPPNILTRDAVDSFLTRSKNKACTKNTLDLKTIYLDRFASAFEYIPLTAEPISKWLNGLTSRRRQKTGRSAFGRPLDPETKWSYQKELIALYHFLGRRYNITYPVWPEERLSIPKKVRPTLSPEQLQQLVKECDDREERAIILTLMDSKIRADELCSLDRENVFADYMLVKGKEGERVVPIEPSTSEALCRLAKKGPLFKADGRRIKRKAMSKRVNRLMVRAGLKGEKLGPHILRHSMSNLHVDNGGDLLTLQAELGHTSLRMTERYARLNPAQIRRKHGEYDVLGHALGTAPAAGQPAPTLPPAPAAITPRPQVPKPSPIAEASERAKGLSGWGELLIIGPKKKPAPAPEPVGSTGQLALGL